jgi:hypothetical protein
VACGGDVRLARRLLQLEEDFVLLDHSELARARSSIASNRS